MLLNATQVILIKKKKKKKNSAITVDLGAKIGIFFIMRMYSTNYTYWVYLLTFLLLGPLVGRKYFPGDQMTNASQIF